MAQTGYTPVIPYHSTTATNTPTAPNMLVGELAANTADKRLYTKNLAGSIVELGTNPSSLTSQSSITAVTTISAGNQIISGSTGSGTGGQFRIIDDGGTLRWVAGILGTAGARNYTIYNNAITSPVITVQENGDTTIGTISPITGYRLAVDGNLWQGNASGLKIGEIYNDSGWYTMLGSTNVNGVALAHQNIVRFSTAGSERMRIDNTGNVGIGTTPTAKFHVESSNTMTSLFKSTSTSNTDIADVQVIGNDVTFRISSYGSTHGARPNQVWLNAASAGTSLVFAADNVERMRVNAAGNVGIGNNNPGWPLVITSDSVSAALQIRGRSLDNISVVGFFDNANTTEFARIQVTSARFQIGSTTVSPVIFTVGGAEKVKIDADGNVGIGAITPTARLDVNGSIAALISLAYNSPANQYVKLGAANDTSVNTGAAYNWQWLVAGDAGGQYLALQASKRTTGVVEALRVTSDGNLGLGTPTSAWWGGRRVVQIGGSGGDATLACSPGTANFASMSSNMYIDGGLTERAINTGPATIYTQASGTHAWSSSPTTTAGNALSLVQHMGIDSNGNLLVGAASGSNHIVAKNVTADAGAVILQVNNSSNGNSSLICYGTSMFNPNAANSANKMGRDATTLRSLSADGTINASGADYAEYENNNGLVIEKGSIVGFKSDGTLTTIFSESIRFAIKSTNPSYVGGDIWGSEDKIGKRPDEPSKLDGETDEDFEVRVNAYEVDLADFEMRLEAARKNVDRIAYSGKVPVNVLGATPGDYIIAIENNDDTITGQCISKQAMTFAQYQDAVGRVNRILPDGRAEVAVIIH